MSAADLLSTLEAAEEKHPELANYTCFVMAKRDLKANKLAAAVSRLRVDWDKFRCYKELKNLKLR